MTQGRAAIIVNRRSNAVCWNLYAFLTQVGVARRKWHVIVAVHAGNDQQFGLQLLRQKDQVRSVDVQAARREDRIVALLQRRDVCESLAWRVAFLDRRAPLHQLVLQP